jgi:asparagine synthetase B (glutamine-hydrolysing)
LELTALDVAVGFPIGVGAEPSSLPAPEDASATDALLAACRRIQAPQAATFVSFSGGRDSSLVLAAATRAARSVGAPDPVPVTLRFVLDPVAEESSWQELVVRHLGLDEWERIPVRDELQSLGEIHTHVLERDGFKWPPNTYFHELICSHVTADGTLLTGLDGDGLMGDWRWISLLHPKAAPTSVRRRVSLFAQAILGTRWRERFLRDRYPPLDLPWLRPAGEVAAQREIVRHVAAEPPSWQRRVAFYARSRYLAAAQQALELVGDANRVHITHPLLDERFLAALARDGGNRGTGHRTDVMRHLGAGLLPEAALARETKAFFPRTSISEATREFARTWNGDGVPQDLVDAELLRAEWCSDAPHFGSATCLATAWLATRDTRWPRAAGADHRPTS